MIGSSHILMSFNDLQNKGLHNPSPEFNPFGLMISLFKFVLTFDDALTNFVLVLYEEVKDEASGRKRYTCTVEGCPEVAAGKSWQNKTSFESHVAKKHDSIRFHHYSIFLLSLNYIKQNRLKDTFLL